MALTTNAGAGLRYGPGMQVVVSGAAGPTAIDDVFYVHLRDPFAAQDVALGSVFAGGSTTGVVIIGFNVAGSITPVGGAAVVPVVGVLDNGNINLIAEHRNNAGALLATAPTVAVKWDPVTGLTVLLGYKNTPAPSILDEILNAVRVTV